MFYTEDGRQASSLEDLNGQTVEVAEAPVQRSQQKMAYARMMADRQSAGSSSGSSRLVKHLILFQRWYQNEKNFRDLVSFTKSSDFRV